MVIDIDSKKINALKKILGKASAKADIERIVNDWIDSVVLTYARGKQIDISQTINQLNL